MCMLEGLYHILQWPHLEYSCQNELDGSGRCGHLVYLFRDEKMRDIPSTPYNILILSPRLHSLLPFFSHLLIPFLDPHLP
jgi:hypothetical protein